LSKELMQKTLVTLGFTEPEAQVYIFLSEEGPHKARDVAEALGIYKQRLYCILGKLREKGVVDSSSEFPAYFSAVVFEKVLDLFMEARIEQQEALKANREELLSSWRSITEKGDEKS
jgi:sugar-specific transcriptional regulator TrmB